MSREEFLSKVGRADIFDPDSETFDEYRYYYSDETNITTFTPLTVYEIGGIGSRYRICRIRTRQLSRISMSGVSGIYETGSFKDKG